MEDEKMFEYEVTFSGKIPVSWQDDYGVGVNPPLVMFAENTAQIRKKLRLPKGVKAKIKKVGKFKHW